MKRNSLFFLFFLYCGFAWTQEAKFTIDVSIDSLLLGNATKVSFTLEGAKGSNFTPPDFSGFQIVAGPSQSSSISMINGVVNQQLSYIYYLSAEEIGNFYIAPASIETEEGILETEPVSIIVVPNPDNIQQKGKTPARERGFFDFPSSPEKKEKKPKKKRRIYRI